MPAPLDTKMEASVMQVARELAFHARRVTCGVLDRDDALSAALEAVARAFSKFQVRKGVPLLAWLRLKGRLVLIEVLDQTGLVLRRSRRAPAKIALAGNTSRETDLTAKDSRQGYLASLEAPPDRATESSAFLNDYRALTHYQRRLLAMRYAEGRTWPDIARRLGISDDKAWATHRQAKALIRAHIENLRERTRHARTGQ